MADQTVNIKHLLTGQYACRAMVVAVVVAPAAHAQSAQALGSEGCRLAAYQAALDARLARDTGECSPSEIDVGIVKVKLQPIVRSLIFQATHHLHIQAARGLRGEPEADRRVFYPIRVCSSGEADLALIPIG